MSQREIIDTPKQEFPIEGSTKQQFKYKDKT